MSLPYPPPCTDGKGVRQSHISEGVITSPDGRPISYMCRSCAQRVIDEYREKLGVIWTFEEKEYEQIDPNRPLYVYDNPYDKGEENTRDLQIVRMCSYRSTKLIENTILAESDCSWCDAKIGDTHARSCPNGERYKQVQQLTQSGKSLPEIIPDYTEKAWGEFADSLSSAASKLGRLGGLAKSEAKAISSRENGKKGGRPRKLRNESTIIEESNLDLFTD